MQLIQDPVTEPNLIRRYGPGEVWVGEQRVASACLVGRKLLLRDRWPVALAELSPPHVQAVLEQSPELLLTGTFAAERFPTPAIRALFRDAGVAVEAMELGAACRTYNVLIQDGREPLVLLFP